MPEFWKSAGYHLVNRDKNGWLSVTPDLLRAYLTRPEIHPVEESCDVEHALFERLMEDPFSQILDDELARIADADTADNYRVVLGFRDHLRKHGTVEGAYAAIFTGDHILIPPVFLDQMVHLILRNILRSCQDPIRLRAAELFFREQIVTLNEGTVTIADAEIVEMMSETGGLGGLGALLMESGTPMREVALDVLGEDNAELYWDRSDRFDTALDFRFTQPGPDALARVIEAWIRHFSKVDVRVQPVQKIRDDHWSWHIGLDADSTKILNSLYNGDGLSEADNLKLLCLFRLDFENRTDMQADLRGKPVWLGLAMSADKRIRMKPQNLLVNLPVTTNS
ncbi:hypothetical protein JM93_01758 [Roseibium hamelinense]|uniref:Uncharacterized protein n=1 Tax=Roseibium hamelinense TaxID=150831 RepID=A0A562T7I9_9HYPH|nr:DUF6352 family protein [Roseibium hamelinense]MTI42357.1 hypothetical protein [Roseibium hamelinense]TWI89555.1 hypothetical protein JM93_01758 [Roseibium hamelinense]